jgi:integrase/recombinase XerD
MLNIYRRHLGTCKYTTRDKVSCNCPIWTQGTLNGQAIKKSLDVRSWQAGQKIIRDWEAGGPQMMTMASAADKFYGNCVARHLGHAQLEKYGLMIDGLKERFAARPVASVTVDDLREWQATWTVKPITALKRIERMRRFFRFCIDSDWTLKNPAKLMDPPKVEPEAVLPFSPDEWERILAATEKYVDLPHGRRAKVQAFVLLLRYSGLRIRDAVTLRRDRINADGKLILRTQKAGVHVYLALPQTVLDALSKVENENPDLFFWSGNGVPKSAVGDWQKALVKLFTLAKVNGGHAHRFRHTFALSLLTNSVSLENVAKLLGNTTRVAERHYSAWVPQRQEALDREVNRAWKTAAA